VKPGIEALKASLSERFAGRQQQSITDRRNSVDAIASFGCTDCLDEPVYTDLFGVRTAIFSAAPVDLDPAKMERVILYIHGGAFVAGSATSHRGICWRLHKATGCPVLTPEYSLAPERCHPTAKSELISLITGLVGAKNQPVHYSIVGDSAGATLTLLCSTEIKRRGLQMAESLVLISPLVDLQCSGQSYQDRAQLDPFISREGLRADILSYAGETNGAPGRIMAEYADLSGLPPVLVQVGSHEVLLSDACTFTQAAEAAGVRVQLEIWPEMIHVWHLFPKYLEQSERAIQNIALFLER
jgi:acetyl esterase/lipase